MHHTILPRIVTFALPLVSTPRIIATVVVEFSFMENYFGGFFFLDISFEITPESSGSAHRDGCKGAVCVGKMMTAEGNFGGN